MPVRVKAWEHGSEAMRDTGGFNTAKEVLEYIRPSDAGGRLDIFGCSVEGCSDADGQRLELEHRVSPSSNGLLQAIHTAYSCHYHLVIRPEDIWFQILTQFSCFVNKNAEALRSQFVAHEGKRKMELTYEDFTLRGFDYGLFATDMSNLLEQNVTDPTLRTWIMPDFSTTCQRDREVAAIIMMATLQRYFEYSCGVECGIPTVTLLGEKSDYEKLLARADKLDEFGPEPTRFAKLLRPVLRRFVATFDAPESQETVDFWRRICDVHEGSGFTAYTGWMSAFCFWDEEGHKLHRYTDADDAEQGDGLVDAHGSYEWRSEGALERARKAMDHLYLDGVKYHHAYQIPNGWVKVPVKLITRSEEIQAEMTAGLVGIACSASGDALEKPGKDEGSEGGRPALDTMQPTTGWWMHAVPQAAPGMRYLPM